jgi:hypothetical protein
MSGQAVGRPERLRRTADWLNAIPVDGNGQSLLDPPDRSSPLKIANTVGVIRSAIASGADHVDCTLGDPESLEAIKDQLSSEELACVIFR